MHGTLDQLLRVEWRPLSEMASLAQAWRDLAGRAVEANVFYEPAVALAAAPAFGRGVVAALVWSQAPHGRLLGFFPMRRRWGLWSGWTHPYAPLGTPLIDAELLSPVTAAWLAALGGRNAVLPLLPTDGPVAHAIARHAHAYRDFGSHRRALLQPDDDRTHYLAQSLGAKRRKELPRTRRRLAETGVVTHRVTAELDAFFALEAGGWKGRSGSAAASNETTRLFMLNAVGALAQEGRAQVDLLCLDSRAIAALVMLRSRDTLYSWKIAYDEAFSRHSPGVQLVLDVSESMLANAGLARIDSCAAGAHPMIDHIWRERLALADRLVCGRANRAFAAAGLRLSATGGVRAMLRGARARLRAGA